MNFKQLVSKVNLHAGLQGTVSTVEGQDYQAYLAEAVRSSFINLQNQRQDFKFLRQNVEFSLTSDKEYLNSFLTSGEDYSIAKWKTGCIRRNGVVQREVDYDNYLANKDYWESFTPSNIVVIKEYSEPGLIFPGPTAGDTISADFYRTPQSLEKNTDVPIIPEEFHYLIVWTALEDVAAYLGMQSIYERHSWKHDTLINKFIRSQVPSRKMKRKPFYKKRIHQS